MPQGCHSALVTAIYSDALWQPTEELCEKKAEAQLYEAAREAGKKLNMLIVVHSIEVSCIRKQGV